MSESLDSRELISEGNSALTAGNLPEAEQAFLDAHENASDAITRDSATVAMIDLILLPQHRYSEARMWIRSIVSNELRSARKKFLQFSNAEEGLLRAPKKTSWENVNLNNQWPKTVDQQTHYDRLLKKLCENVQTEEQRNVYSTWPGPGFTGFVNGIWENTSETFSSIGIQRETVAMAAFDYLNYLTDNPLNSEETDPFTLDAPYRGEEEGKILELANAGDAWAIKEIGIRFDRRGNMEEAKLWWERGAELGNHACMRNLGVIAVRIGDKPLALDWYNKALLAGSKTVYQPISECYPKEMPEHKDWLMRGAEAGDPVALNNLGTMEQASGNFHAAAKYFRRAAEFDPVTNAANLSQMLCLIGSMDEARIWLERAIENKDSRSSAMIAKVQELIKNNQSSKRVNANSVINNSTEFSELTGHENIESALKLCKEILSVAQQIEDSDADLQDQLEKFDEPEEVLAGVTIARGFIEGDMAISAPTLKYLEKTLNALSEKLNTLDSEELDGDDE